MRDPLKMLEWLVEAMADAGHAAQQARMRGDARNAQLFASLATSRGEALETLLGSLSPEWGEDWQHRARRALRTWPSFARDQARRAGLAA